MSTIYSHKEAAIYSDIEKLTSVDGYSWEQLAEMCGARGVNYLRNIVKQAHHGLDAVRFAMLLTALSKDENLRLHRHVVHTNTHHVVPVFGIDADTGSLKDIHHDLIRWMGPAEDAQAAGNVDKLHDYYRFLIGLVAKLKADIQNMNVLMSEERSPGVVGSRSFEKHNAPKGDVRDTQYTDTEEVEQ